MFMIVYKNNHNLYGRKFIPDCKLKRGVIYERKSGFKNSINGYEIKFCVYNVMVFYLCFNNGIPG